MAKERITDGFYDEQQSLFALGVPNFSMWFVALVNRKKNNKPTFLLSSIIISGHFIEWEDHVNILAVKSLPFSILFLPKKSLAVEALIIYG